jgi:cell wall-associated NlpC family hydrolase
MNVLTEAGMRQAIVAEVERWIGTPFRDQSRVRGSGVDCGMLPLAVYTSLGLMPDFDPGAYSVQIHLHKTAEQQRLEGLKPYIDHVREHMFPITEAEAQPGDLVIYLVAHAFAHAAIITDWPNIIHAVAGVGVIRADASRAGRIMRRKREFYTLFGSNAT